MPPEWESQLKALGSYLRAQRRLANLSLRQMADMAQISNPYLSQIERRLHRWDPRTQPPVLTWLLRGPLVFVDQARRAPVGA